MAYIDFNQVLSELNNYGLSSVLLPFILVFTLVYGILEKIKIFEKRSINMMIALVLGFFFASNPAVVGIVQRALPNVSVVLIALLSVILLIGIFGYRLHLNESGAGGFIAMMAFVVVAYVFARASNWGVPGLPPPFNLLDNPETRALVMVVAVFFILIWFITKEDKPSNLGAGVSRIFDEFRHMLKP